MSSRTSSEKAEYLNPSSSSTHLSCLSHCWQATEQRKKSPNFSQNHLMSRGEHPNVSLPHAAPQMNRLLLRFLQHHSRYVTHSSSCLSILDIARHWSDKEVQQLVSCRMIENEQTKRCFVVTLSGGCSCKSAACAAQRVRDHEAHDMFAEVSSLQKGKEKSS